MYLDQLVSLLSLLTLNNPLSSGSSLVFVFILVRVGIQTFFLEEMLVSLLTSCLLDNQAFERSMATTLVSTLLESV